MSLKGALRSLGAAQRRSEREALRRQRELEKQNKQLQKMQELERAAYEVQVYENYIDVLVSIYKDCSEAWNWETIKATNLPIKPNKTNSFEILAQHNLESYKPGIMDKVLRRVDSNRTKLIAAIEDGKVKDEQNYQNALHEYKQNYADWESNCEIASKILLGDVNAYVEAIEQINPFSEISQIGSSIEFKIEKSSLAEATLHVNGEEVIPSETKTLLKSGKLSVKKIAKTNFYELYQDYVCGGVLRIARELFALLPIEMVIVTAVGELLNTKSGHMEKQPILSAAIPRETLKRLNFDMLDPSDSMNNFIHKMKFMKTKGFQPIERISPSEVS